MALVEVVRMSSIATIAVIPIVVVEIVRRSSIVNIAVFPIMRKRYRSVPLARLISKGWSGREIVGLRITSISMQRARRSCRKILIHRLPTLIAVVGLPVSPRSTVVLGVYPIVGRKGACEGPIALGRLLWWVTAHIRIRW